MTKTPTWELVLDVARALHSRLGEFRLDELIRQVQAVDPERQPGTIQPTVQGMTVNAGTGPPSPCGKPLSSASGGATTRWLTEVMVNTRLLTEQVENFVRTELARTYGQPFRKCTLQLPAGGMHEFDAVSADGMVVASVKSSSGRTASGRHPAGKVNSAVAELYLLALIAAPTRLLILTTPEFYKIFKRTLEGKIAAGIQVALMELPTSLQQKVNAVQQQASLEVTPVLDISEQQIAGTTE